MSFLEANVLRPMSRVAAVDKYVEWNGMNGNEMKLIDDPSQIKSVLARVL